MRPGLGGDERAEGAGCEVVPGGLLPSRGWRAGPKGAGEGEHERAGSCTARKECLHRHTLLELGRLEEVRKGER